MYQFSYADIQTDSVADAKDRERQLLTRSIDMLVAARAVGRNSMEAIEALHFMNRVWTSFVEDLGSQRQRPAQGTARQPDLHRPVAAARGRGRPPGPLRQFRRPDRSVPDHPRRHPMKNTLKISLKPNEKIYINGAVIRVDRKVTLELLNDVQFLLESHVLQTDEASTPLRQLYFILQVMLMNPTGAAEAHEMFRRSLPLLLASFEDEQICGALKQIDRMVGEGHVYEALKAIRSLYPLERRALGGNDDVPGAQRPLADGSTMLMNVDMTTTIPTGANQASHDADRRRQRSTTSRS